MERCPADPISQIHKKYFVKCQLMGNNGTDLSDARGCPCDENHLATDIFKHQQADKELEEPDKGQCWIQ